MEDILAKKGDVLQKARINESGDFEFLNEAKVDTKESSKDVTR